MTLSEADTKEFQSIWKDVFHEEISAEEASLVAVNVMALYLRLTKPHRSESPAATPAQDDEILPLLQEIDGK